MGDDDGGDLDDLLVMGVSAPAIQAKPAAPTPSEHSPTTRPEVAGKTAPKVSAKQQLKNMIVGNDLGFSPDEVEGSEADDGSACGSNIPGVDLTVRTKPKRGVVQGTQAGSTHKELTPAVTPSSEFKPSPADNLGCNNSNKASGKVSVST